MLPVPSDRLVCIHGHFYQPPRENPWLEAVEIQDSAAPYHDWNDRITAECYAPNAAARLLDERGAITALRNNYERISFNFGPTLLTWMEHARPNVYAQVLLADHEARRHFGRGNALAQVYGHCIMPLAAPRDQQTQVRWGTADFVHRFGRRPEGMWLPETAVDRRSLAVLAEHGVRFTILAPAQAARVRARGGEWHAVSAGTLDCTRPYRVALGRGRSLVVFFYDAEISHAIAFGGLLNDGHELARRLIAKAAGPSPRLVHIATDGESYGHHHRFGEMALAAALEAIENDPQVQLTNYAAYLDRVAVHDEVDIHENTSWSCAHGVERWRAHCGCHTGAHPEWQQAWRAPLREALDWLKDQLDALFERHGGELLRDPWEARNGYITVLLQRGPQRRASFLAEHARDAPSTAARTRIWQLLEMQRHALLSFTSCGWFFDDPSGIETVQILTYAARAMQLAAEQGFNLEPEFLRRLQPLRSNLPQLHDGRHLYRELVRPQVSERERIVAHYAMTSLFDVPATETRVYAHRLSATGRAFERAGAATFAVGRTRWHSELTDEERDYMYAALHLGGHDIHCAVAPSPRTAEYTPLQTELLNTFFAEPLSELVRRIDGAVGGTFYTLRDVFVEERRRILDSVMQDVMADCTASYERLVTRNRRLLNFLALSAVPFPTALQVAATFVMQRRLEDAVRQYLSEAHDGSAVTAVWEEARRWGIMPATETVRQLLAEALVETMSRLAGADILPRAAHAEAILDLAQALGLPLNLWEVQNRYYVLIATDDHGRWDGPTRRALRRLGERLSFHLREWERWDARAA